MLILRPESLLWDIQCNWLANIAGYKSVPVLTQSKSCMSLNQRMTGGSSGLSPSNGVPACPYSPLRSQGADRGICGLKIIWIWHDQGIVRRHQNYVIVCGCVFVWLAMWYTYQLWAGKIYIRSEMRGLREWKQRGWWRWVRKNSNYWTQHRISFFSCAGQHKRKPLKCPYLD